MNDKTLSSKERALLEAARREAGAKAPPAATSPLDAKTVAGWDHPAAQGAPPKPPEEMWARVAAIMELERRDAEERRQRMRRNGFAAVAVLAVIVLIVFVRALLR